MKIYDSVRQEKVEFKTVNENIVNMYVCGPTLYSDIHIGNARPIIFFDVVRRILETKGYTVNYVSNITDVDDKIIIKAKDLGITEEELTSRNTQEFERVLKELNIKNYYQMPKVVNYMDNIIKYIDDLVETEFAYVVDGQVYFDVSKIKEYGEISKRKLEDMIDFNRIQKDVNKKNEYDFLLWKKTSDGIKWDSPWGKGRPGWHSECACMIEDIFKETIDIHGGGMDLKFPHHENENAQSLAKKKKLANYWMHNGFINIDDEKMSKSIGNVIYVKDLLEKYGSNYIRLLMLVNTYSQPINLTEDLLYQITKMEQKIEKFYFLYGIKDSFEKDENTKVLDDELSDDFNTANCISKFLKIMNNEKISNEKKRNVLSYLFIIFGLKEYQEKKLEIPDYIVNLINKRNDAKKEKNYQKADDIRDEIKKMGYEILDTKEGTTCQKIEK